MEPGQILSSGYHKGDRVPSTQSFTRYTVYIALASVNLYCNCLPLNDSIYFFKYCIETKQFMWPHCVSKTAIKRNVDLTRSTMFKHYFLSFLHNNEGLLLKRDVGSTLMGQINLWIGW